MSPADAAAPGDGFGLITNSRWGLGATGRKLSSSCDPTLGTASVTTQSILMGRVAQLRYSPSYQRKEVVRLSESSCGTLEVSGR